MEEKLLAGQSAIKGKAMDFTEKAYDLEFAVRYGEIGENGVELGVEVFVKPEIELSEYKELKATKKKVL